MVVGLNTVLAPDVREVVEQRTEVDPGSSGFENFVDKLDEAEDVVGAVDEEAGDDTVLTGDVLGSRVNVKEVSSSHRELGVFREISWILIRKRDNSQLIFAGSVVGELMDVWMDLVAVDRLALVEEKVTGKQHVQTELIALTLVPSAGNLPGQPPQSSSWHQHLDVLLVVRIQRLETVKKGTITLGSLFCSDAGPISN